MESITHSDHCITPKSGTTFKLNGEPADLMNYWHYPIVAKCKDCGGDIRVRSYYEDWYHVRVSVPGSDR